MPQRLAGGRDASDRQQSPRRGTSGDREALADAPVSAADPAAAMRAGRHSPRQRARARQNSSPPMRYGGPAALHGVPARLRPGATSSASPAGWPKVSLYALKPSRSSSTSSERLVSRARAASRRSRSLHQTARRFAEAGERVVVGPRARVAPRPRLRSRDVLRPARSRARRRLRRRRRARCSRSPTSTRPSVCTYRVSLRARSPDSPATSLLEAGTRCPGAVIRVRDARERALEQLAPLSSR